jgi:hypothetical protein
MRRIAKVTAARRPLRRAATGLAALRRPFSAWIDAEQGLASLRGESMKELNRVLAKAETFYARADGKFDAQGQLTDEATTKVLAAQMSAFETWIRRMGPQA